MTQAKNNVCRCFGVITAIALLTSCANLELQDGTWADNEDKPSETQTDTTTPIDQNDSGISSTNGLSAEELEQSAVNKKHPEKEELQLYAASAYLDRGELIKTASLLEQTNQNKLPQLLQLRKEALYAALAIENNDLEQAEQIIERLRSFRSKDPVFNNWIILAETKLLERRGNFLQLLELLTGQTTSIDEQQKQQHLEKIWALVKEQSLENLKLSKQQSRRKPEMGWIELGIIDKKHDLIPPAIWQQSLSLWENEYKNHSAIDIYQKLSETVATELDERNLNSNSNIALLLPLSSPYQEIAETIRDGFKSASSKKGQRVSVYDTGSNMDQIVAKYQQAIAQGAQIIVGPLGKAAANKLASEVEIVRPTLLLGSINKSDDIDLSAQTFMFSLDPEHEAESIANLAYNRGYSRAAVLYPESGRGKRLNSPNVGES